VTGLSAQPPARSLVGTASVWLIKYAFLLLFAGMVVYFVTQTEAFLTPSNVLNILRGSVIVLIIALALTVVISSGGIDLSVGVALDFGAWFAIVAMASWGLPWPLALVVALVAGSFIGVLNAVLIVGLGVTPFLATLGTFFIGRSIQQIGTDGGANINYRQAPDGFVALTQGSFFGMSMILWIGLLVITVYFVVLELSTHGRRISSLGMQNSAAKVAGIDTSSYRVWVYVSASATAAIGGILLSSGLRIYTPLAGFSYLLDGIAAVFIGASLHRDGRPNVVGTLIGVLFLGALGTGLDLLGIDFNVKAALKGVILVLAIALALLVSQRLPRVEAFFDRRRDIASA
jgi:ribose transport system permease protein